MARRAEITALHEHELREFLQARRLLKVFDEGLLVCVRCGAPVRDVGISAVRMVDDALEFTCGNHACGELLA